MCDKIFKPIEIHSTDSRSRLRRSFEEIGVVIDDCDMAVLIAKFYSEYSVLKYCPLKLEFALIRTSDKYCVEVSVVGKENKILVYSINREHFEFLE